MNIASRLNKGWVLYWLVVALVFVLLVQLMITAAQRIQGAQARCSTLILQLERESYRRGFADGMYATLKHAPLATNVVEIAPILKEMK